MENWRQNPARVPWYCPSWGALAAAALLDAHDRPHEHHQHLHLVRI